MVHRLWRKGRRREGEKGVRIPTLAVQPTPESFAGLHDRTWGSVLSPFASSNCEEKSLWKRRTWSRIKCLRVRKVQSSPSACWWEGRLSLETQTFTVLGLSELFQGLWESSQKISCWIFLRRPEVSKADDSYTLQTRAPWLKSCEAVIVTFVLSEVVENVQLCY